MCVCVCGAISSPRRRKERTLENENGSKKEYLKYRVVIPIGAYIREKPSYSNSVKIIGEIEYHDVVETLSTSLIINVKSPNGNNIQ